MEATNVSMAAKKKLAKLLSVAVKETMVVTMAAVHFEVDECDMSNSEGRLGGRARQNEGKSYL